MDSASECSEIVTNVIKFTRLKTLTVNHESLPIFILFYRFSHLHLSPLEGAIDLSMDHHSVLVLPQSWASFFLSHNTKYRERP